MRIFKKKIKPTDILERIDRKNYTWRFLVMAFGMLLIAINFNVFLRPFNIVPGGVSGAALIFNHLTNIPPSSFIYVVNAGLLYLALFFLGPKFTIKTFFVSMLLPFFIDLTSFLGETITFGHDKVFLVCIYSGLLSGIGAGLVFKAGFTTGGTDTLKRILQKKSKIPIAKASVIVDGIIVILGAVVFQNPMVFMYSIIVIFLSNFTLERILLGISNNKAFYIISDKGNEIIEFAAKTLNVKASLVKVEGSLHHSSHKMILIIVPTKDYYELKEAIKTIDDQAFFTIIDVYQTYGLNYQTVSGKI